MTISSCTNDFEAKAEIRIWLDDLRPAPEGYIWCRSVNEAKKLIISLGSDTKIAVIDCDHDLGTMRLTAAMASSCWTGWRKMDDSSLSPYIR